MKNGKSSVLIYVLIGLAIIGIASQLFTNTVHFFSNLFVMLGMGLVLFAAIYFLFFRNRGTDETKKYKQAVKQSKRKYKRQTQAVKTRTQPVVTKSKFKKRPSHLRVIDGNKTKKKKRASN